MALSNDALDQPRAGFADGIEFEETFPEVEAPSATPRPATPRLSVVRSDPAVQESEALFQEQLERRLQEAEAVVKRTIENVRVEEEQRLAEWVRIRREEEERRLATWAEERRSAVERSIEQRTPSADDILRRVEEMLVDWQERFEHRATHRQTIAAAGSARDVGRILRESVSELTRTSTFALAVHHDSRDAVAYRYRVATDDEVGDLLRRDSLDDGPDSAASHATSWVRAHRTVRAGARNATVHAAQLAVRVGDAIVGVLTLQSEKEIDDDVLARIADLAAVAAPRLATLRDSASLRSA